MQTEEPQPAAPPHAAAGNDRLELLILAWLWCQRGKPAKASSAATAMKPLALEKGAVEAALQDLAQAGLANRTDPTTKRGKPEFAVTPQGSQRVEGLLHRREPPAGTRPFTTLLSYDLPAIAADLPLGQHDKKSLGTWDKLLPAALCIRHFRLDAPLDQGPDAAKLALVKLALAQAHEAPAQRIHLKKLPAGPLPALVVGPILGAAGQATAASNLDNLLKAAGCGLLGVDSRRLKPTLVRNWLRAGPPASNASAEGGAAAKPASSGAADGEMDAAAFAQRALSAAREAARAGGEGVSNLGDKVMIHAAWRQYERMHGPMPLDEFKRRLSRANGDGVVLAREDLIGEDRAREFVESEVRTGESSYHYIRI